jgi:hypothetical protein
MGAPFVSLISKLERRYAIRTALTGAFSQNYAKKLTCEDWVIARLISHGTRSEAGSRAFALLASVIETCRRRGASSWRYLGTVIAAARKGLPLPPLPAIPAAA